MVVVARFVKIEFEFVFEKLLLTLMSTRLLPFKD